ncbi:MAG TPA: hypothetical protein VGC13_30555 [Longimicrobium sp.]|jgi:hypothetical protein|uniref:hypothetical protein n=1 Tax=Longimicrobium sp. TaxID=2029185 RepID=UPI002ED8A41E
MTDEPNRLPIRKLYLIGASVATVVAVIAGISADLFELSSNIGWWRVGLAFAIVSLLAAAIAGMREMLRLHHEVEALKEKRDVEYLRTPADVLSRAAALLDASESSLEYYGGLNLINADAAQKPTEKDKLARWWNSLSERLKQDHFYVTRYIDFLMPSELAGLYDDQHVPLSQIRDQVAEYTRWIERQAQAMAAGADGNAFYNLRGAPIWQWGMHVLVFDRRHVMLVFTNTRRNYRALVLTNEPDAANDIHEAFETWHRNLRRQPISIEQLRAAVENGNAWILAHSESDPQAPAPGRVSGAATDPTHIRAFHA